MKVAYFITRSDTIGGAQIHVRDLAEEMIKRGNEVTVFLGGNGRYIDQLKSRKINYQTTDSLKRSISLFSDIFSMYKFWLFLREHKPELVSLHSAKAGLLGRVVCRTLNIPVIFTAHGWSHIRVSNKIKRKAYILIERILALSTKKIILVCEKDKNYAEEVIGISKRKLVTIHNGMPEILEQRKNLSKKPTIISVARFQEPKDFSTLLRALYKIKEEDWHCRLIGDGPLLTTVKHQAAEMGLNTKIDFPGASNSVGKELVNADIFILSSKSEGFPRSIIEAMRAKLPVIASDVGGISESVTESKTGYLVPPGDSEILADRIKTLVNSPSKRKNFGNNGFTKYSENFTFTKMFELTYYTYRKVIL